MPCGKADSSREPGLWQSLDKSGSRKEKTVIPSSQQSCQHRSQVLEPTKWPLTPLVAALNLPEPQSLASKSLVKCGVPEGLQSSKGTSTPSLLSSHLLTETQTTNPTTLREMLENSNRCFLCGPWRSLLQADSVQDSERRRAAGACVAQEVCVPVSALASKWSETSDDLGWGRREAAGTVAKTSLCFCYLGEQVKNRLRTGRQPWAPGTGSLCKKKDHGGGLQTPPFKWPLDL